MLRLYNALHILHAVMVFVFWPILGSQLIQVVDQDDQPVAGAVIEPVSPSINGAKCYTNKEGKVWVPFSNALQRVQWINVSKVGYKPVHMDVSEQWPDKIVLQQVDGTRKE